MIHSVDWLGIFVPNSRPARPVVGMPDDECQMPNESSTFGNRRSTFPLTVIDKLGQATKGVWWMSWHREATKDVVACDMPREAGKQALIRGFLNEETQLHDLQLPATEFIGGMERTW